MEAKVQRNYKKEAYWSTGCLILLSIIYLLGFDIVPTGKALGVYVGATIGVLIGSFIRKDKPKELEFLILPLLVIANHFLFKNNVYIPNHLLLYIGLTGLTVYYLSKSNTKSKNIQIVAVALLLVSILFLDYYMYTNRILKDINFDRYVRKEYGLKRGFSEEDLSGIDRLLVSEWNNIISMEGIQYFSNLKKLNISDMEHSLKGFSLLSELKELNHLTVWYIDLGKLEEMGDMSSIEELELLYNRKGRLAGLDNFSNLKNLYIQGLSFEDLTGLQGPESLETMFIGYGEVLSFNGIEEFKNLKELTLNRLIVEDISVLLTVESLEKVVFDAVRIENLDQIRDKLIEKGIVVYVNNVDNSDGLLF